MPVTLQSNHPRAAMVMVAKSCISRGEEVTIIVSSQASADELRLQFDADELQSVKFSIVGTVMSQGAGTRGADPSGRTMVPAAPVGRPT
jgi:hypothetical protein